MKHLAMCYPPIIHSGGDFQLNYSDGSNDEHLQSGTIICSLGVSCKSYSANIARTLVINSPYAIHQNYNFLREIESELLKKLIPGAKLNEIYASTVDYVRKKKVQFVAHLVDTFGFSIGMEFDDSSLIIGPNCTVAAKQNMVFNVTIGLNRLEDENGKLYALLHSDIVVVKELGPAVILTPPPYLSLIYDCWVHVFDNLPLNDVLAIGQTCKHMRQFVVDYWWFNLSVYSNAHTNLLFNDWILLATRFIWFVDDIGENSVILFTPISFSYYFNIVCNCHSFHR